MCFRSRFADRVDDFFFMRRRVGDRFDRRRAHLGLAGWFVDRVANFFFMGRGVSGRFGWGMRGSLVRGAGGLATAMIGFIFMGGPMGSRLNARMGRTFVDSVVMEVFEGVHPHFFMADWFHFAADNNFHARPLKPFDPEPVAVLIVHKMVHFAMGKGAMPFLAMHLMAVEVAIQKMTAAHENKQGW